MQYRRMGDSDLDVSAVCLGCWGIGGEFYGEVDDAESIRMIHAAEDGGVNFLDTAVVYGSGRSEEVIGRALADGRRDHWIIATKWGRRALPDGSKLSRASADWLVKDLEQSLTRLRTDVIDLYQLHFPDPETPLAESMAAMVKAKQAGKVRHIGVSNVSAEQLEECLRHAPVVSVQPQYSMFHRSIESDLLPLCRARNVGTMVYCPLARGLLTGKFTGTETVTAAARKNNKFFKGDNFAMSVAIVERLKQVARDRGVTMAQLAVGWTVAQPGVTSAICGAKHPEQIRETAGGADVTLDAKQAERIETILADVAAIQ